MADITEKAEFEKTVQEEAHAMAEEAQSHAHGGIKLHLTEEMKEVIRDLVAKKKQEMKDAGEWDYNNLIYSISRAYSEVLDGLIQAMELDKEEKDAETDKDSE